MGTSRRETWLAKHDLWLYCSCSIQLPEQMRPVWPHGVAVDICPLHQPLSRNSWTVIQLWLHLTKTPLRKKQDWELNCYQSWGKAPHSNKVVMFQELEHTLSSASWQFNSPLCVYLIRPRKSNHKRQICWKAGMLTSWNGTETVQKSMGVIWRGSSKKQHPCPPRSAGRQMFLLRTVPRYSQCRITPYRCPQVEIHPPFAQGERAWKRSLRLPSPTDVIWLDFAWKVFSTRAS